MNLVSINLKRKFFWYLSTMILQKKPINFEHFIINRLTVYALLGIDKSWLTIQC